MTEPKIEETVRGLADEVLSERLSVLSARGLRVKMEVKQWSTEDRENSEIRISFWRQNRFVDFFEGFIVRGGRPLASLGEFKEWLEREVDIILGEPSEESPTP
jgi:hypothetical protein